MARLLWKLSVLFTLLSGCGGGSRNNDQNASPTNDPPLNTATNQWVWRNPLPSGNHLNDVVWNGERLVAAGNNGTTLTSINVQDWTQQNAGVLNNFNTIIRTGDQFVAVGGSYEPQRLPGLLATRRDGVD